MCTRNLALLFAPSVFQTDGRGEHEVRVLQELIDGYISVFDVRLFQLLIYSPSSYPCRTQTI
jgi:hypothetical protein